MQYYPEDFKKAMVVKMAAPGAQSATALAKETGVPQSTLSRWLRSYATVRLEGEAKTTRLERRGEAGGASGIREEL
jgi:transposase-like protein